MKKLFFVLCVLCCASAYSNHNMAGHISYIQTGTLTYKIIVNTYTNTAGTTADRCVMLVYMGNGDSILIPRINGPATLCMEAGQYDGQALSACIPSMKFNRYEGFYTYPGAGTYQLQAYDPNRTPGLCNLPGSETTPFVLRAEIVANPFFSNSSAVLSSVPVTCGAVGTLYTYDPQALDFDSVYYELISPALSPGYTLPTGTSSFSINSATGLVTWDEPFSVCNYIYGIRMSEYRTIGGVVTYLGSTSQEIWARVNNPTGIEETAANSLVSFYPNPAETQISFTYEGTAAGELNLFDISGRLVQKITVKEKSSATIGGLNPGIYSYRLISPGSPVSQGKFVLSGEAVK
jgi:hypothetical protein